VLSSKQLPGKRGVEAALERGSARPTATISGREPAPLRRIDGAVARATRPLIEKSHPTILRGEHRIGADRALDCGLSVAAVEARAGYRAEGVLSSEPGSRCNLDNFLDLFDWHPSTPEHRRRLVLRVQMSQAGTGGFRLEGRRLERARTRPSSLIATPGNSRRCPGADWFRCPESAARCSRGLPTGAVADHR
jgi:hypothetical protein